ncbi:hypothetical protein GCM10010448_35730 [Streptomyces glomeratus]|uniref:Secreted protein n=1 Tax=Streptomyces glomeratus TaxID=284452 RepID=A0ABP6LKV6_9ACTN
MLDGTTVVLVELEGTVLLPVSSWMPNAVPPPIAAATIATAARRASGPFARFFDVAEGSGSNGAEGPGSNAGGGGHSGFTGEETCCCRGCADWRPSPWGYWSSPLRRKLSVM